MNRKVKFIKRSRQHKTSEMKKPQFDAVTLEIHHRRVHIASILLLAGIGLLYSCTFFNHFACPSSDFVSFYGTGKSWLAFKLPDTMQRGPVYSIISASAGAMLSRADRYIIGADIYNAMLLPLSMILIYLIARPMMGNAALWAAILAGTIPWVIRQTADPLAEMTLIALGAAAVACVRSHIRWAYFFAMLASIARWDMAAAIPAVAIVDIMQNRKWFRTITASLLASIPFALCMLIVLIQMKTKGSGSANLDVMAKDHHFAILADMQLYVRNVCSFLTAPIVNIVGGQVRSDVDANALIFWLASILLAVTFTTGIVLAIKDKIRPVIAMLIIAVPYILIHAFYPWRLDRFCVPMAWVVLIIAAFGVSRLWQYLKKTVNNSVVISAIQFFGALIFAVWAYALCDTLTAVNQACPPLFKLTVSSIILVCVGFFIIQILARKSFSTQWLIVPAFLVLAIISNAIGTGITMSNGQKGINFQRLAKWFAQNAKDNENMATTMAGFMPFYCGLPDERFLHTSKVTGEDGNDFSSFIKSCDKHNITYIAWDARSGALRHEYFYKLWKFDKIDILGAPFYGQRVDAIGRCKLIQIFSSGEPQIAVYKILPDTSK
ncbi:MAG: hypothetical protein WC770_01265 [Phycisphaerae bacterium]|jgi:hypothetical protein